jgi:HlyD family secretion protein
MKRKMLGAGLAFVFLAVPVVIKMSAAQDLKLVDMSAVSARTIQPAILASGNLAFGQEIRLSSEVIGKVSEILVREGQSVQRGDVLLRLDPSAYQAEVDQHESNRRSANIAIDRARLTVADQDVTLERDRQLLKANFIGMSKFDASSHALELAKVELRASQEAQQQAQALLSQARQRLAKTEVRAPITGTVTSLPIKVGETAVASATGIAGSSLMTIANVDDVLAEVNVDEADIARVAVAQKVRVYPSAFSDTPLAGTVEWIALEPKVGTQSRTYVVKVKLAKTELKLRSGMTCRVEIVVGSSTPRPVLPLQAILTDAEPGTVKDARKATSYVLTVVNGTVRRQNVQLGIADDNNQEVLGGVKLGTLVAVGPPRLLRELHEGDRVAAAVEAKRSM